MNISAAALRKNVGSSVTDEEDDASEAGGAADTLLVVHGSRMRISRAHLAAASVCRTGEGVGVGVFHRISQDLLDVSQAFLLKFLAPPLMSPRAVLSLLLWLLPQGLAPRRGHRGPFFHRVLRVVGRGPSCCLIPLSFTFGVTSPVPPVVARVARDYMCGEELCVRVA